MSYSIDAVTSDCYEGTSCLINKLGIHDEKLLNVVESHITIAKISMLEKNPIDGAFDFEHYRAIHRFIFDDLYEWAGEVRKVNISKKGTLFADVASIHELAEACFRRLKEHNCFRNLGKDEFVDSITDFYCVTNNLHPFREGNGRTQRVFLEQLALNAGYDVQFHKANVDDLMIATIQAANGVDTYLRDILSLITVSLDLSKH